MVTVKVVHSNISRNLGNTGGFKDFTLNLKLNPVNYVYVDVQMFQDLRHNHLYVP